MSQTPMIRTQVNPGGRALTKDDQAQIDLYGFTAEDIKTMRAVSIIPPDVTAPVLKFFAGFCAQSGLSPIRKEVYLVQRKTKQGITFQIQTGIDGFRAIAHRTGELAGIDDAKFTEKQGSFGRPDTASVTVYRLVQGQRVAYTATVRWDEFYPGDNSVNSFMWKKMPYNQLAKCAEAAALRKGFSPELGQIYEPSEMGQARTVEEAQGVVVSGGPPEEDKGGAMIRARGRDEQLAKDLLEKSKTTDNASGVWQETMNAYAMDKLTDADVEGIRAVLDEALKAEEEDKSSDEPSGDVKTVTPDSWQQSSPAYKFLKGKAEAAKTKSAKAVIGRTVKDYLHSGKITEGEADEIEGILS